jgi:hypothetical protein
MPSCSRHWRRTLHWADPQLLADLVAAVPQGEGRRVYVKAAN